MVFKYQHTDDFKRLLYVFAVVCQKYKKFFGIEQQIFQIFDKMKILCRKAVDDDKFWKWDRCDSSLE